MNKIRTFWTKVFRNFKAVITAQYEKEARDEDPRTYEQLITHLYLKNAHRGLLMCVCVLIMGIVEMTALPKDVFGIAGVVLLILSAAVFMWLFGKASFSRETNVSLLRTLLYGYWGILTAAVAVIGVSRTLGGEFPCCALGFTVLMLLFPIMNIFESLTFTAVIFFSAAVYGLYTKQSVTYYLLALFISAAYIWLSAIVRCCSANIWLGERRLDMTEERCRLISQEDSLTGLLNKTGLSAKFAEIAEHYGNDKTISVILIDIDNFRAFNHMYGYDKSDECLYRVCKCIKIVAKPYTDLISRFGGDDFVLVFENMNELDVVKLAEQLRQSVETMAQTFGDGIVTVSVGVSGTAKLAGKQTYSDLLNEADNMLMIAKNGGKNCIGFKGKAFLHESRRPVV